MEIIKNSTLVYDLTMMCRQDDCPKHKIECDCHNKCSCDYTNCSKDY